MHEPRPAGVTLVCALTVIGALIELFTAQQWNADYEQTQWLQAHVQAARIEQFFSYLHAGVSLLCAYFMLQAKNWARYLYLTWNTLKVGAAVGLIIVPNLPAEAQFLRFGVGMLPGMVFFLIALGLLWRPDARSYFRHGGHRHFED